MKNIDEILERVGKIETHEIVLSHNSREFEGKKIITFGTFDLFHIGHKKIIDHALKIAKKQENLVIAISSDKWNKLKGKEALQNQEVRMEVIKRNYPKSIVIFEDHLMPEESWPKLWDLYGISLIIMGGDHIEKLSYINDSITPKGEQMKISFFQRTPDISSSLLRNIKK